MHQFPIRVAQECSQGRRERQRTGDMDHVEVVSGHELDGHILPTDARVGTVTGPDNVARLADVEDISGTGLARGHIRECRKGSREGKQSSEYVSGEHVCFSRKKR